MPYSLHDARCSFRGCMLGALQRAISTPQLAAGGLSGSIGKRARSHRPGPHLRQDPWCKFGPSRSALLSKTNQTSLFRSRVQGCSRIP